MDPSLPVLVTRLPDRRALARLVNAALRHEIAHVALSEAPGPGQHTLDLHVTGSPPLALLAELAGAPREGHFPMRLRPLHRAQAAELYAMLEAEHPSSPEDPGEDSVNLDSGPPDTEHVPRTLAFEAAAPAPGPDARRFPAHTSGRESAPGVDDPRRTSPSAHWAAANVAPKREAPRSGAPLIGPAGEVLTGLPEDPRSTARSASWNPPLSAHPADGEPPSLEACLFVRPDAPTPRSPPGGVRFFDEEELASLPVEAPPSTEDSEDDATLVRLADVPARVKRSTRPPPRLDAAARDPLLGRSVAAGKYTIEAAIGSGAAGAVYRAMHRELRRTVAIKVLHPHYQQDPHFMKSFRGEALAASQLDHPNVMRVLDFGQEPDGLVYIVMEYLSGRTLQSLLDEEHRLLPERAVGIMMQVCAALSVAHDNGIIHRDIKPDNIMLVHSRNDEGGTFELVKVCDFGIAALQNAARDADVGLDEDVIAGTPEYMSPEQVRGSEIDARSDVYACGICLYELVTGRPPFIGDHPAEILVQQVEEPPEAPSRLVPGLDSIVEEIILRAIEKEPSRRQQSARELRGELKEMLDPAEAGASVHDDGRSLVESVPVIDDPASGVSAFFIALASAVLRSGRFERGHPEAAQAMKDLVKATRAALRGRRELTFARRDSARTVGFCVMSGDGEVVDLRRVLGPQLFDSFGYPFIEELTRKGVAAITLREGIPEGELRSIVELLLGPHESAALRAELLTRPMRQVSVLFAADVVGRDRRLSWKVGLCAARLGRDLRALSSVRGISLKQMREVRQELVTGVAHLLTTGEEVRQFLFNADLVDGAVASLRGFSGFKVAPLMFERLRHQACVEAVPLLLEDFDRGERDRIVISEHLRGFATRLLAERSASADAAIAELYRRGLVSQAEVPRDLQEQIGARALAEELIRHPSQLLRAIDLIQAPEDYARELGPLEAAMAVLARRAEAASLLAVMSMLARHARGSGAPGPRESLAQRTMKSMIDQQRLAPIGAALLTGPPHQREPARQLLLLAGSAGAHALYLARERLVDAGARPLFVQTLRQAGPAGWSLLASVLPRIEAHDDQEIALVEDLLRAVPDRQDAALGEAVARFLAHPQLRPAALSAIVPLWGERARKPLMDALELAEEPARLVAITELRRMRGIDEATLLVLERLLTTKVTASEELRAAAAAALADVTPSLRGRAVALLARGVEGKRGLVAMLRGDGAADESVMVLEAMARALLALDRAEGTRALRSRLQRSDAVLRARLTPLLQLG